MEHIEPAPVRLCPDCDEEFDAAASICPDCGTSLNPPSAPKQTTPIAINGRPRRWLPEGSLLFWLCLAAHASSVNVGLQSLVVNVSDVRVASIVVSVECLFATLTGAALFFASRSYLRRLHEREQAASSRPAHAPLITLWALLIVAGASVLGVLLGLIGVSSTWSRSP